MKGFSKGMTTVYITEAITLECEFWVAEKLRYTPSLVQYNKETTKRWDTHVEKAVNFPWADEILHMQETILE